MANKRISTLDDISLVGGTSTPGLTTSDIIPVTDVDDTTGSLQGTTKKVTVANLVAVAPQGDLESANNLSDLANAATARTNLGLGTAATTASTDYATAAQGATADSATQPGDNISTLTNDSNFIDSSGAPVQSVAGRTGVVTLSNTDVSGLGTASTQNVGTADGNVVQLSDVGGTVKLPTVDGSQLTNVSGSDSTKLAIASNLSDLANAATARTNLGLGTAATTASTDYATASHTHAINDLSDVTITTAQNEDVIKFNGTSFVNGQVSVDVDTPLTTALRGTDNPHIGANPNQSFKVIDNPDKSVMVIADASGNLEFLVNSDSAKLFLNKPSLREEITTGVSVKEDSTEPDIEITTTSGTYSLITGDSDALGANGLPARQGFNVPDIGANQAPLLISGGTIS